MKRIVRKILCLLIYVLCFQSVIKAQTLNDVAHSKEITWYGIDFSCARFQNFDDKFKTEFLKDSLLNFWSMNPLYSGDKNFIRLRYDKDQIGINVRNSRKRNREINYDNLFTNLTNEIDADTVREIVSEYDLKGTGFGVLDRKSVV